MPLAIREGDQLKPTLLQPKSAYKLSCRRRGGRELWGEMGGWGGQKGMGEERGRGWRKERLSRWRKEEIPSAAATLLLQLPGPQLPCVSETVGRLLVDELHLAVRLE